MSHSTFLEVKGLAKAVVIHNGDLSGPAVIRCWAPGDGDDEYEEVVLGTGILPALLRAFLVQLLPGVMERAVEAFVKELTF